MHRWCRADKCLPLLKAFTRYVAAMLLLMAAPLPSGWAAGVLPRFPNSQNDVVVFVARDHLYSVPVSGGEANALSTFTGKIFNPRYSPDGHWIAFTGVQASNANIYVIPAKGGVARQLTFQSDALDGPDWIGPNDLVQTWTPDSQEILFLSRNHSWHKNVERLFAISVVGGLAWELPVGDVGSMVFAPNGSEMAFTRTFSDFRPWKRYDGGLAPNIFTYDLATEKLDQLTIGTGTHTAPMWFGRIVYYLSDQQPSRRVNLWAYDLDLRTSRQVTHFEDFDIDFPSLGLQGSDGGYITFQQGGRLMALAVPSEELHEVPVSIPDGGPLSRRQVDAGAYVRETDMAGDPNIALRPDGKIAIVPARGDLFSVHLNTGERVNLTDTSSVDEDHPAWSPDGQHIAYISNITGERQVIILGVKDGKPDDKTRGLVVTRFTEGYLYSPKWAPDSRSLAVSDSEHRLWLIGLDGGRQTTLVTMDPYREIHDASFSPDGRWLAYSVGRANRQSAIHLYEIDSHRDNLVSADFDDDSMPRFSPDGQWLYFVSKRNEIPVLSDRETEFISLKADGIFSAKLLDDVAPNSHQARAFAASDLPGLMQRVIRLNVPPTKILEVEPRGDAIFYVSSPPSTISGVIPEEARDLHWYGTATAKDQLVIGSITSAVISQDGKRVLYKQDSGWHVADAVGGHPNDRKLVFDQLVANSSPAEEWVEMYEDAWRFQRDMYYSKTLDGVDWQSIHDRYAKFLLLLGSDQDFSYLIGQLQGEVGSSHEYFDIKGSGPQVMTRTPLLGADFGLDKSSGRYYFAKILRGDGSREHYRGPLNHPSLGVLEGDYLFAVNGQELIYPVSPYALLSGLTGPIKLTISSGLSSARRDVVVTPVDSELALREYDHSTRSRELVKRISGGRVGYMYLSDFSELGAEQFLRQYYSQQDKNALIIDVRWNNGGFTSQALLERLRRPPAGQYLNREGVHTSQPDGLFDGPKALLINHQSASDADQFAYFFQKEKLGTVVGTRSWGGVRGILGPWPLLNGSSVNIPKDVLTLPDGSRPIENSGVVPDIEIESIPSEESEGKDVQLETAASLLMQELDGDHDAKD